MDAAIAPKDVSSKPHTLKQIQTTLSSGMLALQSLPTKLQQKIGIDSALESYFAAEGKPLDAEATTTALNEVRAKIDAALETGELTEVQAAELQAMKAEIEAVVGEGVSQRALVLSSPSSAPK